MEGLETILISLSSIFGFLLSKKYILPYIWKGICYLLKFKKDFDDRNVDASKELLEIKDKSNDVYENQISFLTDQVKTFEDRIKKKQEELNKYLDELQTLRTKVLELQRLVYNNQVEIAKLNSLCCSNINCLSRIKCTSCNNIEQRKK